MTVKRDLHQNTMNDSTLYVQSTHHTARIPTHLLLHTSGLVLDMFKTLSTRDIVITVITFEHVVLNLIHHHFSLQ